MNTNFLKEKEEKVSWAQKGAMLLLPGKESPTLFVDFVFFFLLNSKACIRDS